MRIENLNVLSFSVRLLAIAFDLIHCLSKWKPAIGPLFDLIHHTAHFFFTISIVFVTFYFISKIFHILDSIEMVSLNQFSTYPF